MSSKFVGTRLVEISPLGWHAVSKLLPVILGVASILWGGVFPQGRVSDRLSTTGCCEMKCPW
jgi:hypothetical protein